MKNALVYIAGPFRGANAWEVENNIRDAESYGFKVAEIGAVPVIPHTMYRFWDGTLTDEFWLAATLETMRRCDAVLLLPNWKRSTGSKAEKAEAIRLGMPVFESQPFLALRKWLEALP